MQLQINIPFVEALGLELKSLANGATKIAIDALGRVPHGET